MLIRIWLINDNKCKLVVILAIVFSEDKTKLIIKILELLSVFLDLRLNLLALIIKLVSLLNCFLNKLFCLCLFFLYSSHLTFKGIEVISATIKRLSVALLFFLYSPHF